MQDHPRFLVPRHLPPSTTTSFGPTNHLVVTLTNSLRKKERTFSMALVLLHPPSRVGTTHWDVPGRMLVPERGWQSTCWGGGHL